MTKKTKRNKVRIKIDEFEVEVESENSLSEVREVAESIAKKVSMKREFDYIS